MAFLGEILAFSVKKGDFVVKKGHVLVKNLHFQLKTTFFFAKSFLGFPPLSPMGNPKFQYWSKKKLPGTIFLSAATRRNTRGGGLGSSSLRPKKLRRNPQATALLVLYIGGFARIRV